MLFFGEGKQLLKFNINTLLVSGDNVHGIGNSPTFRNNRIFVNGNSQAGISICGGVSLA
jgi:hypothetical protein